MREFQPSPPEGRGRRFPLARVEMCKLQWYGEPPPIMHSDLNQSGMFIGSMRGEIR